MINVLNNIRRENNYTKHTIDNASTSNDPDIALTSNDPTEAIGPTKDTL